MHYLFASYNLFYFVTLAFLDKLLIMKISMQYMFFFLSDTKKEADQAGASFMDQLEVTKEEISKNTKASIK